MVNDVCYTLLAELHRLKLIMMPAYKLVLVKHRTKVVDDEFRKQIRDILKKISDELFVNPIVVRHNDQIIDYSIAIVKIRNQQKYYLINLYSEFERSNLLSFIDAEERYLLKLNGKL